MATAYPTILPIPAITPYIGLPPYIGVSPYISLPPYIPPCNKELILPPLSVELPTGLGFHLAALPVVSAAYGCPCGLTDPCTCVPDTCECSCGARLPVTTACSCAALATPVCPRLAPLVKPIIL